MIGAELIVDSFVAHGVGRLFVYPGGTIAPILDQALARQLELITARHEQGAGYAALAAARLTRQAQVAMVTSGPGVTNIITAVADAFYDSAPLIVISGQVGTGDLRGERAVRQFGFQEVDAVALLRPVTKAQFQPHSPDELDAAFAEAFRIACEGRPGPVLIDLPMNVQRGELSAPAKATRLPLAAAPQPEAEQVARLAAWLREAERPVIVAGQGVLLAGAHEELRALAIGGGIPVSQSLLGLGAFPTDHPLALGFHGHTGNQVAGMAIHNADLVVVCGSRLDVRQTGSRAAEFAPGARIVRIETDAGELAHSRVRADLAIAADVGATLRAVNAALAGAAQPDRAAWQARIAAWRAEYPLSWPDNGKLKPQQVVACASRLTRGERVVVVSGVGSHQQWSARHFDYAVPQRTWLTSGGHGAMGFDLPVAAGAQLTDPQAKVICLVGDGSFQINIQELGLIAEHDLPVKIVVLDNHRLGIVSQFQKLNWASDPTCGNKWNPDFAAIARGYGIQARRVDSAEALEATLAELLAAPGPALIHCVVDPDEDVRPMLLAGQTLDGMWPYR